MNLSVISETVKVHISYSEFLEMSYPDFIFVKNWVESQYEQLKKDLKEKKEGVNN